MIKTVAAALALFLAVLFGSGAANAAAPQSGAQIATKIVVEGNQRIEESTVLSYMVVKEGQPYTQAQVDQSLKTLYATGLFSDVTITPNGGEVDVKVVENRVTVAGRFSNWTDRVSDEAATICSRCCM